MPRQRSVYAHPDGVTTLSSDVALRRTFGAYPTGVVGVAGLTGDPHHRRPAGLAASSFTPVSLQPSLVSVCVAHSSTTWPQLADLPRIGISVLSAGQERISRQLGERGADRFAGVEWDVADSGAVLIRGAAAFFEVSLQQELPAGDHDILLFEVRRFEVHPDVAPLIFHASSYRSLG